MSYKLFRPSDPETSRIAAESVNATQLEKLVYDCIEGYGPEGCISDEVRAALSYKHLAYSSVTSRYKSLRDKGLIGYTGEKRKGNSSRPQQVMFARTPEYLYARKLWESKEDE